MFTPSRIQQGGRNHKAQVSHHTLNRQASIDCHELLMELASPELRTIGNYQIKEILGSALKIIDKSYASDVVREIEHWRRLHHPRVIRLFEVMTSETKIYLAMELANQGEMLNWLKKHRMAPEYLAKRWFCQLAGAVSYLHRRNLVHRDLKLENILLDDDLNIKLVDFGFAREFDSRRMLDTYCGSVAYAAPEVDVWSMGVILFTILCGHLPFDDEDPDMVAEKVTIASYQLPTHLSSQAQDLIQRIFKVKPKERVNLDQILTHPWLQEDELVHLTVPNSSGRDSSPARQSGTPHSSSSSLVRQSTASSEAMDMITLLTRAGINTEAMLKSVKKGAADTFSAFYYLLQQSFQRRSALKGQCSLESIEDVPKMSERSSSPGQSMANGIKALFKSKSRSPVMKKEEEPKAPEEKKPVFGNFLRKSRWSRGSKELLQGPKVGPGELRGSRPSSHSRQSSGDSLKRSHSRSQSADVTIKRSVDEVVIVVDGISGEGGGELMRAATPGQSSDETDKKRIIVRRTKSLNARKEKEVSVRLELTIEEED